MKILITGSNGFIAKNLIEHLKTDNDIQLYLFSKNDSLEMLEAYTREADFIFHLAGVNRPKNSEEFYQGNGNLTKKIIDVLLEYNRATPIVFSSSTQAEADNDYGKSKQQAESHMLRYHEQTKAKVFIYRLSNVFGKWSKPNYNSVIATWCHNIANDLEIQVNDKNIRLNLVYVDDVVESFMSCIDIIDDDIYRNIEVVYQKTLGDIESLLYSFKNSRVSLEIPRVGTGFERALYATYLSHIPVDKFSYGLNGHRDDRGTFYEILKTIDSGQFSISTTAAGITRGNHYHHTKNEKFLVVKGKALIEYRHIVTNEIISYSVSDKKMEVVEMIPGYTHNITNTGDEEMVLFLWANETFNPDKPDTYFLKV